MFAIILSGIAIILCSIACVRNAMDGRAGAALAMAALAVLNMGCLFYGINRYKEDKELEPKIEQVIVSDVLKYQIDSTETIHAGDTTKTFVIKYWIKK